MKAWSLALWSCLLLGACASHSPGPARLDDKIAAALQEAAAAKPAAPSQAQVERMQEALLPPLRLDMPASSERVMEPRFDLVVSTAPAGQVFNSIVSGTRYSMLVHPDVTGTLSVSLKDVTVQEALDSIRQLYGYEFKVDGTRIFIQPAGLQTRVFQVNYLIGQRSGRSDVRVNSGSSSSGGGAGASSAPGAPAPSATGGGSEASRVSTVSQNDFWSEFTSSLRALVGNSEGRNVVVNPQAGVVVVRAFPAELRNVEAYLRAMRLSVERQVMIEAKLIEVTLNEQYQAGVNWAAFPTNGISAGLLGTGSTLATTGVLSGGSGSSANPGARSLGPLAATVAAAAGTPGAVFGLAFQTQNFAALLQFLESQGVVQVLSSPRVATLNNQKAVLKVGVDQYFITNIQSTQSTTTASGGTTPTTLTPTFSPFFSGISLDITPQIDIDGNILLHVHPLVSKVESEVGFRFNFGGGIGTQDVPLAKSTISETDTIVRAQDGNIVALGGLMKVEISTGQTGVPGAQDVPGVGAAFRSGARSSVKKELVILIKPTVIQSDADSSQELRQASERILDMFPPAPGESR